MVKRYFGLALLCIFSSYAYTPLTRGLAAEAGVSADISAVYLAVLNAAGVLAQPTGTHKQPSCAHVPLFTQFPELADSIAHVNLCALPTPVEQAPALSDYLGTAVWIKRDDLTGPVKNGKRLYGGNKPRKLEFLLAQALEHGAQHVATFGCVGSNHATATAVYAHELGLHCTNFLKHQEPSPVVKQNLLLSHGSGADLRWYPDNVTRRVGAFANWIDTHGKTGEFTYLIPTGGSNPLGALGFVNAALELCKQIDAGLCPQPDAIYLPAGSLGTFAGLTLGLQIAGKHIKIVGVATEPHDSNAEYREELKELYAQTNALLCAHDSTAHTYPFPEELVEIRFEYAGTDYGMPTAEGAQAQEIFKQFAGLTIDQTYTAKAAACMLADAQAKRFTRVLYWNTYCGLDFSHITDMVSPSDVPVSLQTYVS